MGIVTFSKNWIYWTTSFVAIVLTTLNKRFFWRTFWSIVAVGTIVAFVVQSVFLIREYLQFGKTTNMQINVLAPASFPAVTVCSLNPYQYSRINYSTSLSDLMHAYDWIVKTRQAELRANKTAAALLSKNLTQDQSVYVRELTRHKRQAVANGTFFNRFNSTMYTFIQSGSASSLSVVYCDGNGTSLNFRYNQTTDSYIALIIDAVWAYCLGPLMCDAPVTICTDYANSFELLEDLNDCAIGLQTKIPNFQYPPNRYSGRQTILHYSTTSNPAAAMSMFVGSSYCSATYMNTRCDYGDYAKPTNKYNGTYIYKKCTNRTSGIDTLEVSITQCDGTNLPITVVYPSNCTGFIDRFVSDVTNTMAQYDCGLSCVYPNPIVEDTGICGNTYYYNLLTQWSTCNLTSSTIVSTTTQLTTTELTTTQSTTADTTTVLTTTTQPTTSESTTLSSSTLDTTTPAVTSLLTTIQTTSLLTSTQLPTTSSTDQPTTTSLLPSSTDSSTSLPTTDSSSTLPTTTTSSLPTTSDAITSAAQTSIDTTILTTILTTDSSTSVVTSTPLTSPSNTPSTTLLTSLSTIESSTAPNTWLTSQLTTQPPSSTTETTTESSSVVPSTDSTAFSTFLTTSELPTLGVDSTSASSTFDSTSASSTFDSTSASSSTSDLTSALLTTDSTSAPSTSDSTLASTAETSTVVSSSAALTTSTDLPSTSDSSTSSTELTSFQQTTASEFLSSTSLETTEGSTSLSSTSLFESTSSFPTTFALTSSFSSSTSALSSAPLSSTEQTTSSSGPLNSMLSSTVGLSSTNSWGAGSSISNSTNLILSTSSSALQTTALQQQTLASSSQRSSTFPLSTQFASSSPKSTSGFSSPSSSVSRSSSSAGWFAGSSSLSAVSTSFVSTRPESSSHYPNASITPKSFASKTTSGLFVSTRPSASTRGKSTLDRSRTTGGLQSSKSAISTNSITSGTTRQSKSASSISTKSRPTTPISALKTSASKSTAGGNVRSTTVKQQSTPQKTAQDYDFKTSDSQPTTIAKVRAALEIVGAGLTTKQRDQMAYSLPQLVTSCLINREPCDMENDFNQVFDVDYGYCYTFNYKKPKGTYFTPKTGAIYGLNMLMFNNVSDYLPSTENVGFKIVIHDQDYSPFPNTEGYMTSVGTSARLAASENYYTRLGSPYGHCDTLDSLEDRNQPFYYNGTYSTEGCFRSCFQDLILAACGCADSRFPYTGSEFFCNPMNQTEYNCYLDYIEVNGDYYDVNCTCYYPCEDTMYSADVSTGNWPAGTYFNELHCPVAAALGQTCSHFYQENAAQVTIYYRSLVFTSLQEDPTTSLLDVFNNMAGNTGLWIGFTSITVGEIVLVLIQTALWLMCCKRELPEVPSCRRRNYPESDEEEEDQPTNVSNSEAEVGSLPVGWISEGPKMMPNSFSNNSSWNTRRAIIPEFAVEYERVSRMTEDYVPPVIAHSGDASSRTVVM